MVVVASGSGRRRLRRLRRYRRLARSSGCSSGAGYDCRSAPAASEAEDLGGLGSAGRCTMRS